MAGKGDHRITPQPVVDAITSWMPIHLDPCWNEHALTAPRVAYDGWDLGSGLAMDWDAPNFGCVFVNGPWSNLLPWVHKALLEHHRGNARHILFWGLCYTEAGWARALYSNRPMVCFWSKRVHHPLPGEAKPSTAVLANQLIYLGPDRDSFARHFRQHGTVMRPL